MKKPRLWCRQGIWYCKILCAADGLVQRTGYGTTPTAAFNDWRIL